MNYEPTPDCICGGTMSLPCPNSAPDDLLARVPCGECIARYDRTHCLGCDKRFAENEGRCVRRTMAGEHFLCEACAARIGPPAEDCADMVRRRRAALAKRQRAIVAFNACCSRFDREKYAAALAEMREASREAAAVLAEIDGAS